MMIPAVTSRGIAKALKLTATRCCRFQTHWIVERPPGQDRVILMSRGAATAVIQDKVYSTPMDVPPPEPWIITARQNHGPNVYT